MLSHAHDMRAHTHIRTRTRAHARTHARTHTHTHTHPFNSPLSSTVDYIMVRQEDKAKIRNVKVITSEE